MRRVSHLGVRLLQRAQAPGARPRGPPGPSPRGRLGHRAFWGLRSGKDADPRLDADGGPQASHIVRHVSEHPLPRVLPPPRLPALRVSRLSAHAWLLRAHCRALPPRAWNTYEAVILGSSARRALADRLAANQSRNLTSPTRAAQADGLRAAGIAVADDKG